MKRLFDILFSIFGLIVSAPVCIVAAVLIKVDSRGPVFFHQDRVGKDGKIFRVIKYRTMVHNPSKVGPKLTARNDPRVTPIGQILRWLKIDEFPQLLNVLRGEMSIIGPRPEIPTIVDLYTEGQRKVLSVKPGMLGPSQILGRDELEKYPDDVDVEGYYIEHILPEKLAIDLEYVEKASLIGDIKYLFYGLKETLIGSVKVKYLVESRRRIFYLGVDTLFCCLSYVVAFNLRFDWEVPWAEYWNVLRVLPIIMVLRPAIFVYFGLYQSLWKYLDVRDIAAVVKAVSLSTVLVVFFAYLVGTTGHPRSVFIIDWFLLVTFMISFRLFFRYQLTNGNSKKKNEKNVLIVGAGDTGESLAREILNSPELGYKLVGFIDDDPKKKGMSIHGLKILGRCYDIPQIVELKNADEVIVAISRASSAEMNRILSFCEKARVKNRIVPSVSDLISGKVYISKIRNVEVSDLLGRESLKLDISAIRKLIAGRTIMITGGAGSIGVELCRQILGFDPSCLIVVDRGENALLSLKWEINRTYPQARVQYYLRDVAEKTRLREVFRRHRPQIIFHCAGLNHIPIVQGHEERAFMENVYGTKVVADLSKTYKAEKFIFLSTDKAAYPTSVVGATKKVAELVVQKMARESQVVFLIIRFGTVLNSQGTFLEFFKRQLQEGGPITVSHPEAKGYFMTAVEAVELILQSTAMGKKGETLVLGMGEKVKIADIAQKLVKLSGLKLDTDIAIEYVGLPPGEKLIEELWEDSEKLLPSRHKKIKRIHFRQGEYPSLEKDISEMRKMAVQGKRDALMRKLCELVPTYEFPGKTELLSVKPPHGVSSSDLAASISP